MQVNATAVPGGDLDAGIAQFGCPAADVSNELKGALSPMNWARKMAGPLMVFMF